MTIRIDIVSVIFKISIALLTLYLIAGMFVSPIHRDADQSTRKMLESIAYYYGKNMGESELGILPPPHNANTLIMQRSLGYYLRLIDLATTEAGTFDFATPLREGALGTPTHNHVFQFAEDRGFYIPVDTWGNPFCVYCKDDTAVSTRQDLVSMAGIGDIVVWSCGKDGKNDWGENDDVCLYPNLLSAEMTCRREKLKAEGKNPMDGFHEWLEEFTLRHAKTEYP